MSRARKKKKTKKTKTISNGSGCLSDNVRQAMEKYFTDLDGHEPAELYHLILSQVEIPLFESVLDYTDGNVTRAADMLGLNRGTLRNRLIKYELE
jgi:Fis family transcriptional regulator, factor for inversion stimulation protein